MLDKDAAVDRLMSCDQETLAETAYYMYEDQYGSKGRHLLKYTVPEIVSWILSHYEWSYEAQCWETKIPFDDDIDTEIVQFNVTDQGRVLH